MGRAVLGVAELIILGECAEARGERCQEMVTEENAEKFTTWTEVTEVAAQACDTVRSKIFNFYSMRPEVISTKLKTKLIREEKGVNVI